MSVVGDQRKIWGSGTP